MAAGEKPCPAELLPKAQGLRLIQGHVLPIAEGLLPEERTLGVAYAQDGKIKKVAVNTYLITPYNVDLLGDLIDELENNGLYF